MAWFAATPETPEPPILSDKVGAKVKEAIDANDKQALVKIIHEQHKASEGWRRQFNAAQTEIEELYSNLNSAEETNRRLIAETVDTILDGNFPDILSVNAKGFMLVRQKVYNDIINQKNLFAQKLRTANDIFYTAMFASFCLGLFIGAIGK